MLYSLTEIFVVFFCNVLFEIVPLYQISMLIHDYHLLVVSRRKSHLISRVHFIKEISFSEQKIKERFYKILNSANLLTNSQVKLIKSLQTHKSILYYRIYKTWSWSFLNATRRMSLYNNRISIIVNLKLAEEP